MIGGRAAATSAAFNMDAAVTKLLALASDKRATRQEPKGDGVYRIKANPFILCRIGDLPEPTPEAVRADDALRSFADELAAIGGLDLMVEVFDEAAERHGYRAVGGVSSAWSGSHGWWH